MLNWDTEKNVNSGLSDKQNTNHKCFMQLALFLLFKLSHLNSRIYMPPLYERCEIQSITMSINQLYN